MLALLLSSLAVAPAPDVARALGEVYRAGDFQSALPGAAAAAGSAAAHPTELLPERFLFNLGPLAAILSVLIRVGAVVGLILGVLYLVQRLVPGLRAHDGEEQIAADDGPGLSEVPLRDAHALAREGRFAEAIHVLLLRTLEQLVRRPGMAVAPGWTSRELLERANYPKQARDALAGLVDAVETCTFAGRPATEQDFLVCVDRFRQFAQAFGAAA